MTKVTEPGFSVDLPGVWESAEGGQPGSLVYRAADGNATLTVVLLAVRPAYSIADRGRLHSDYMRHRSQYELGQVPSLVQSEPVASQVDGAIEGSWSAVDSASGRRQLHRVLLAGGVLGDFCYEEDAADEIAFNQQANSVLATASVDASNEG